jgi:hypothetical protein
MAKQSSWWLQYKEAAPISSKKNDELCQTEMGLVYLKSELKLATSHKKQVGQFVLGKRKGQRETRVLLTSQCGLLTGNRLIC